MRENINKTELKGLVKSYRQGLDKNETTSCMIRLSDVEALIKHYRDTDILNGQNPIDGFRIYFYRPEPTPTEGIPGRKIYPIADGRGQMSIILVPTHNYNEVRNDGDVRGESHDMFIENGVCQVFIPGGEHTGLCPKNCPQ